MDKDSKGFITLNRNIFEHWIFQDAEKFRAFVDLIQLARWKDEKLLIGNEIVIIPRGSYYTSELKLAERWGWSRKKTREYLKLLEGDNMIAKKGTTKGTMLTVENYELYQCSGTTKGTSKEHQRNIKRTTEDTSKEHQKDSEGYTKEEIEEIKEFKQGKERVEVSPNPISFPSDIHKLIFNNFTEVGYRTWFIDADINEDRELITIIVDSSFKKEAIEKSYCKKLGILTGRKIVIKVGDLK